MRRSERELLNEVLEELSDVTAFLAIHSVSEEVGSGEVYCQVTRVGDWHRCDFVYEDAFSDDPPKMLASYKITPSGTPYE